MAAGTTVIDRLILQIEARVKSLNKIDALNAKLKKLERANITFNKSGRLIDMTTKRFVSMDSAAEALREKVSNGSKVMETTFRNLQNLFLGMGLAFLFTGMALQRFFQNILTSLFTLFLAVEGETGVINERVNELKAEWAAIKFKIVDDAVINGVIDKWIDRVKYLMDLLDNMDPSKKANLVDFAIKGLLAASAMMVLGMAMLFLLGPLAAIKFLFGASLLNPVNLFLSALLLVVAALALLIVKFGGLKNFGLSALNGLLRAMVLISRGFVDLLIAPIEWFIGLLAELATALKPSSKVAIGLRKAETFISDLRQNRALGAADTIAKIDSWLGMDEVREEFDRPLLERLLGASPTTTPTPTQQTGTTNTLNMTVQGSIVTQNEIQKLIKDTMDNVNKFTIGSPQS